MNVIDLDKEGNIILDITKVTFSIEVRKNLIEAFEKMEERNNAGKEKNLRKKQQ